MAGLGFKLKSLASSETEEIPACSPISGTEFRITGGEWAHKNSVRSQGRSRPAGVTEPPLEQEMEYCSVLPGEGLAILPVPRPIAKLLISNGNSLMKQPFPLSLAPKASAAQPQLASHPYLSWLALWPA